MDVVRDMSARDRGNYSFARLIKFLMNPRPEHLCLEINVARALEKELGKNPEADFPGSVFAPTSLIPVEQRAERAQRAGLDSKSGSAGGYTMAADVGDFVELLRETSLLSRLGCTFLSLSRTTSLPVLASGASAAWASENPGGDISQVDPTFTQVPLSPRSLLATVAFSKSLFQESNSSIEGIVRSELALAASAAIDAAGINGSGLQNQPVGLLKNSGINIVSGGVNGLVPTFANILDLEYNASLGKPESKLSFLSTLGIRKLLRTVPESTNGEVMVWRPAPEWGVGAQQVLGYNALASTQVPSDLSKGTTLGSCHALIAGDFSQLVVAEFGVMSLLVDRFAKARQGVIEVTCFLQADVNLRHAASFAAMVDAKLS